MPKRVNQTKKELLQEIQKKQHVEQQRKLALTIFPSLTKLKSVYDAQTALTAVAGFIKQGISIEEDKLNVSSLEIDLSKEKDSDIKKAVIQILGLIKDEKALDVFDLTELMGRQLPQFLAGKAMKGSMKQVTAKEFIAD